MENAELNMKTEPMHAAGKAPVKPAGSANCLPVGTRLLEFELTEVIGEGGFGAVYLAFDHSLQRTVAIKEYMPTALAERNDDKSIVVRSQRHQETFEAGLRSFINEARLLAQFDHPALIKVHRFLEQNNTAYMAMRYYKGRTLKQILKTEPELITESWLKAVIAPLLDALDELHKINILHRDISPDNIMIQDNGAAVLLDFGAARQIISDLTQMLTVILKPGYAPVEQYADDTSMKQGPWTDIYALSAVVYTVITRKPPPTSVARMIKDPIKLLSVESYPQYSAAFLDAINKGMAVNPEHRPQTIAEFGSMLGLDGGLTQYLEQRTVQPTPAPAPVALTLVQPPAPVPPEPAPVAFEDDNAATVLIKQPVGLPANEDPNATQKYVPPVPAPAPAPAPISMPAAVAEKNEPAPAVAVTKTAPVPPKAAAATRPRSKRPIFLAGVLVLVAAAAIGITLQQHSFDAPQELPPAPAPVPVAPAPVAAVPATPPAPTPDPAAEAAAEEEAKAWDGLKDALPTAPDTVANLNAFIAKYPNGKFLDAANLKLAAATQAANDAAAAAAAAAKLNGTITFAIAPWGNVYIDDAPMGPSPPLRKFSLPEGKHHIRVVNANFPDYSADIDVKKGATSAFKLDFTQAQ